MPLKLGGMMLVAVALLAPGEAAARDFAVTSFDGTRIEAHFFPAASLLGSSRAPTVLYGPGWGNGGSTDENRPTHEADGTIGVGTLRRAGYNVLTWDPRGFGKSGGEAKWDSPLYEARDVQALIDAAAGFPEVQLDGPGDPRLGMAGASYGGGIQWATAAIDTRVDAITPVVAWHSLVSSLYKAGTFKTGWGSALCGAGAAQGISTGLVNVAGAATGSMDPHMYSICRSGLASGRVSQEDSDWLVERGPGTEWMQKVRAPALVLHGTVDTLFPLSEAIANFQVLRANGVPARMMWFCGGHGTCNGSAGLGGHFPAAVLRWFGYHLKGETGLGTGARFEWIDQHGRWHTAADYPLADDGSLTASGSGLLRLVAGDASSGTATAATPSTAGVTVSVAAAGRNADLIGAPRLELEYKGTSTPQDAHAFAQIVDPARGVVVGGQVTPLPLKLDGARHTLQADLEPLAYALGSRTKLELQVIPSTSVYGNQRATGSVDLTRISVTLPLGRPPAGEQPQPSPGTTCRPVFSPRRVRRRSDGRVRIRPRIRCGDARLRKRVRITDGRRRWRRRTGVVSLLRVRPAARRLTVRFRHAGTGHRVRVRIRG